ncbi:GTP cyclohydrolase, partial [Vibrio cholerae O1]|nr:GTP cyclohydrolase [Vibrio cholerae O1]
MAGVRARVGLKVGAKSKIDAGILSRHGPQSDKEHAAVIF